MFAFIWQRKPEAVRRSVLYNDLGDGGLRLVNIALKLQAFHLLHIQRLITLEEEVKWKFFAIYWLGITLRAFEPSLASNLVPHSFSPPPFYEAMLRSLRVFMGLRPNTVFGTLCTKVVYWELVNSRVERPHIETKHPLVDFDGAWSDINLKEMCSPFRPGCFTLISLETCTVPSAICQRMFCMFSVSVPV